MNEAEKLMLDATIAGILGPERSPMNTVILDGRLIPRLVAKDCGPVVSFVLDGRFGYYIPREVVVPFVNAVANAMAIGAGYPWFGADSPSKPFAPLVRMLGSDDDLPAPPADSSERGE